MNPTPENLSESPERVLINKIKNTIDQTGVLMMPESDKRVDAANAVLKEAGIMGVGDLESLLAARNNKNVNQEGLDMKVDDLGIAIGEWIGEKGTPEMQQAVKAGSFSTEKFLPEAWKIVVEGDERDQSLARVIVDGAIESRVPNVVRRDAISNEMESVDYYVNNPQYGRLGGQIEKAIIALEAMKSPLRAKEMGFISEKIDYLERLREQFSGVKNEQIDRVSGQDGTKKKQETGKVSEEIDPEAIMREHMATKDQINTSIEDPNEILRRLNLEDLPAELVNKLMDGNWFRRTDMTGVDPAMKATILSHKSELREWMQSYRAKMAALTEMLERRKKSKGEVDEITPIEFEYIYECLDHIEKGGFKSDDLTRNSARLDILFSVSMGYYTNVVITEVKDGKKVVRRTLKKEELDVFQNEIAQRLFFHDSHLAMSKCHTIEDYVRTLLALYEGDTSGYSACRRLVETILHREEINGKRVGMGLKQIPVDMAWDMRQVANHQIFGFVNEIAGSDWFLDNMVSSGIKEGTMLNQIVSAVLKDLTDVKKQEHIEEYNECRGTNFKYPAIKAELEKVKAEDISRDILKFAVTQFLWPEEEIKVDKTMRLNSPVYKNFWLMERDGLRQYGVIKEYMLQKMQMCRFSGGWYDSDEGKREARKRVEKAFDLGTKAPIVFADNRCDIKYSGNEYSSLLNLYFSRIADNRQVVVEDNETGEALVKSKFAGGVDNIPFIWAAAPYWLEFAKKKSAGIHTPYDPLLIEDLGFNNISRGNDMLFQFTQLISTQSFAVAEALTNIKNMSPQELRKPGALQGMYAKFNKVVAKGFAPARVYPTTYMGDDLYGGWKPNREGEIDKKAAETSTYRVAERMREYYVDDLFLVMRDGDATYEDFVMVRNALKWNGFMSHRRYNRWKREYEVVAGGSFIKPKRVDYWAKKTGVEARVRSRDLALKGLAHGRWGSGK